MGKMSDLISREKLIETIRPMVGMWEDETFWISYERVIDIIESAEPERKWIPVTEALPEEREWLGTKQFGTTISNEVYVTFENPKGERFCKHLSFQNGKLSRYDQSTIDAFYQEAKPIAWMPLPDPWKEE